jgi:hypothetical protein
MNSKVTPRGRPPGGENLRAFEDSNSDGLTQRQEGDDERIRIPFHD